MSAVMMPYGKMNMVEQAEQDEIRRLRRRRIVLLVVSVLVLVVVVTTAAVLVSRGRSDDKGSGGGSTGPSDTESAALSAIKTACNVTLYPEACVSTLSPVINGTKLDPREIFRLSLQIAMGEVRVAYRKIGDLKTSGTVDPRYVPALEVCERLLNMTYDKLNETAATRNTLLTSAELVDDFKTWLSAAITYQDTCLDGLDGANPELWKQVSSVVTNSTRLSSNSLAIFTKVAKLFGFAGFRRRLMSYGSGGTFPAWMSSKDRMLLQEPDPRLIADIVVAKDGTGRFTKVSAAVAAATGGATRTVIYVKEGVYDEIVVIGKSNIMLVGDGPTATIITGSLNVADGTLMIDTPTVAVYGEGFIARDICFQNTAGAVKEQAVALLSNSDKSVYYRCRFDGFQDTLYTMSLRQFYRECDILGTVDFIYGDAAVVFQLCNIMPRVPLKGQPDVITAQGKSDPNQNTGTSIHQCAVTPLGDLSDVKLYLGRPWRDHSNTVFMKTLLPAIVHPEGWMAWSSDSTPPDTIFYGEYMNTGPGSATDKRVDWKGVHSSMTEKEAVKYTVNSFVDGNSWIPATGVPFVAGL